jgi:hypothetical protein
MPSEGEEKRIKLFRDHSADLERVRPELKGRYLCPLCLAEFTEEAVLGASPKLTLEDCIPKGLGPIVLVLTCDSCNNTAGAMIDSQLHTRLDFESFCKATQEEPVRGRMTYEGLSVGIEVIRTGGPTPRMDIKIIEEQSNKEHIQLIQDTMKDMKEKGLLHQGMKLHFGPKTIPHNPRALTALLKAAYLLFFKAMGYGAILSSIFDPVRRQIRDNQSKAVDVESVALRVPLASLPTTLCQVNGDLSGVGVPIPLSKYDAAYMVILPTSESTYARWEEFYLHNKERGIGELTMAVGPPKIENDSPSDIDPPATKN